MIHIGTSGFSYDDWKGHFYPERIDKKDMLSYYASVFNAVEINASYYTIPSAASVASMDRKTPDGFRELQCLSNRGPTAQGRWQARVYSRAIPLVIQAQSRERREARRVQRQGGGYTDRRRVPQLGMGER